MFAPVLVGSALELAAARADDAVAVAIGRRTITYGELDALASALAFALEQRGVAPGDRVPTLLGGAEALVAFWAIAKRGAVGVPLDAEDEKELARALRDLDARALVVDASVAPTFHHAVARAPDLRAVIVRGRHADLDETGSAAYVAYETALAEEDPRAEARAVRRIDLDDAWLERDEDGALYALSHRALLARAASLATGLDLAPGDVVSGTPPWELAVACALAGAAMQVAGSGPEHGAGRVLWVGAADEDHDDEAGVTAVRLHRSARGGPIALLAGANEPARVLPNVDVRVVDERGESVGPKVVGELEVRSSGLAAGAASTSGFFRAGQTGMLDDAGLLYVL